MSAITEPTQERLDETHDRVHRDCIVCGQGEEPGLGLHFEVCPDGSVEARFTPPAALIGYDGLLHGGVTSSLLDGAMTNCLFARGLVAVTAELTVRFRHPVTPEVPLTVRAELTRIVNPLYILRAEIWQNDQLKAKATARFMERSGG